MINNIKAYRSANHTLDKFTQLTMLYDTAISSMQQAKEAIISENIELRYNKLEKAFLIVTGLRDALDMERGADVAETLREWYTGLGMRIININSTNDTSMVDLCMQHLKEMRDAFIEAKKISDGEQAEALAQTPNIIEAKTSDFLPDMAVYYKTTEMQEHKPMVLSI